MINNLNSWYPVNIYSSSTDIQFDWRFLPDRFRESFFYDTILKHKNSPENKRDNLVSDIHSFINSAASFTNVIKPSALVFHISRCGSTLISQMLAWLNSSIVISESEIINQVIRLDHYLNEKNHDKHELFQTLLKYIGRKRFPDERNLFIKLDSWHLFSFEFINSVLPDVPKVILYRNPLEVVLSHQATRGIQMIPGTIKVEEFPYKPFDWENYELDKYVIFVLYNYLKSILKVWKDNNNILLMNYHQLPESVWNSFAAHTGINFSLNEIASMKETTKVHSKNKHTKYKGDAYLTECGINKDLEELIELHMIPVYKELEEIRITGGF